MTSLTSFVTYYKKVIILFGIFVVVVAALMIFFDLLGTIRESLTGSNRLSPTVVFGKLPKLDLSEGVKSNSNTIYKIETITGDLPKLDNFAKVFVTKQQVATFSDLEDSKFKAKALGFEDMPVRNFNGKVEFKDPKDESKKLTVETISQSFKLESNYLGDPDIISGFVLSQETAKNSVIGFFKNMGTPIDLFPEGKIVAENYKIEGGKLVQSISLSSANLVKVILNRADIDNLPIIDINSESPFVWAITNEEGVVAAEYNNYEIKKHKFSTYPLKTVESAFEELKNGNGILNKNQTSNVIEIRKVGLGYLQTRVSQEYLQPVFVFESDNGLAAFVSAVNNAWAGEN